MGGLYQRPDLVLCIFQGVPTAFIASQRTRVATRLDPVVWQAFNQSFGIMRNLGAYVLEGTEFPALQAYLDSQAEVHSMQRDLPHVVSLTPLYSFTGLNYGS